MIKRLLAVSLSFVCVCAAEVAAGAYAGKWNSDQQSGDLHFTLTKATDGSWTGEAGFTNDQGEVAAKVKSVKVDGDELEIVITFDDGGAPMHAALKGKRTSDKIDGTYTAMSEDGTKAGEGTWSVKPVAK